MITQLRGVGAARHNFETKKPPKRAVFGGPYGVRTRVSALRGLHPSPLDEWAMDKNHFYMANYTDEWLFCQFCAITKPESRAQLIVEACASAEPCLEACRKG